MHNTQFVFKQASCQELLQVRPNTLLRISGVGFLQIRFPSCWQTQLSAQNHHNTATFK